jgi:biopolymer transport protein ExbD
MENHKMTKPQKLSVNVETGEEILIDLTADEIATFEASVKALEDEKAATLVKIKTDEEAKALAEAKLAALGLTTDDLKALGL